MVADARNRLLKFKEAQMQSHGRILTPATLAAMLLTDRQLKGAGQCVVSGTSVDPAIDAYTQFLHRYALHVRNTKKCLYMFMNWLIFLLFLYYTGSSLFVCNGC